MERLTYIRLRGIYQRLQLALLRTKDTREDTIRIYTHEAETLVDLLESILEEGV